MTRTTKKAAAKLNTAIAGAVKRFAPPESLTVDEWADKHRRLSPESSAEAGPWRTKRTPYLEEPMRAFTDPKVHKIVMVPDRGGHQLQPCIPLAKPVLLGRGGPDARGI